MPVRYNNDIDGRRVKEKKYACSVRYYYPKVKKVRVTGRAV